MTKVDLITGMLGSGKTTFIRKYAQYHLNKGRRIAILLNDYGAVNIDMVMLKDLECDRCEVAMVVGGADADCHKRRFKTQLINLGMQHFDRVIIEPSGIFDMDEYFDTLYESPLDRWYEKGSVITIADPFAEDELSDEIKFITGSESACCGSLVVSKLTGNEDPSVITGLVNRLNSSLEFIKCKRRFTEEELTAKPWNELTDEDFEKISSSGYRNESYIKLFNRDTLSTGVHYFMHVHIPEDKIISLAKDIFSDSSCGKIYRIKGSLQAENGSWLRLNATPSSVSLTPAADGQAVLIVIGDSLDLKALDERIRYLNTNPEYVSI
ncbi:MAG: GTPase (G3E family) [Oscillospiraceae bacterium]|nr:GTPase (G3E family) [Oscillospiraceae bacterium]